MRKKVFKVIATGWFLGILFILSHDILRAEEDSQDSGGQAQGRRKFSERKNSSNSSETASSDANGSHPRIEQFREEMKAIVDTFTPEQKAKFFEFQQKATTQGMGPFERRKAIQEEPFFQTLNDKQKEFFQKPLGPASGGSGALTHKNNSDSSENSFTPGQHARKRGSPESGKNEGEGQQAKSESQVDKSQEKGAGQKNSPRMGQGQFRMMGSMGKFMDTLTPEQKQKFPEFRSSFERKSPEERLQILSQDPLFSNLTQSQKDLVTKAWQEGKERRMMGRQGEFHKQQQAVQEKWETLSSEEKKTLREFPEKSKTMSFEERFRVASGLPLIKDMTAEQRKTFNDKLKEFQQMPTEQRDKILENLELWRRLSPEQREEMRRRAEEKKMESAPAEQSSQTF